MAIIQPFKALRPQPQLAKQVASRPYDVLNSAEAIKEAAGNPASFLHITKSEFDLTESVDIHDAQVYEQAKENLAAFIKRDVVFRESKECYYIYQLIMHGRAQTGLVCVSSVDDYENDIIKKHEFTRPEKELDRINHIKTSGAQTGNVFLAYRNNVGLDALIENWKKTKTAVYDFEADDETGVIFKNIYDILYEYCGNGDFNYNMNPRISDWGNVDSKSLNSEISAILNRYLKK
jgi:uncharacterized protein (DUF1015 family)